MLRTYKLKSFENKSKTDRIILLLKEYRKSATLISKIQWNNFFLEGFCKFNKQLKTKTKSKLSARYIQTCQYQVVGILESFLSNLKNRFIEIVSKSSLSSETKKELFYINKYSLWFSKNLNINKEIRKMAHSIFKNILKKYRKPSFKNINMNLDFKVAKRTNSKTKTFDYWINLSSLEKGKLIHIPLKTNKFFANIEGEIKNFTQININKDKELSINLIKEIPNQKGQYKEIIKEEKIAIDIGLVNLISTNKGDLFGKNIFKKLLHFDSILQNLIKGLNRRKIKLSQNKKYKNLTKKIRSFLKNEVNGILNKIIKLYRPKEIILENLNFQNSKLSKRMNRILNNFGLGKIIEKLNSLNEFYGVKITFVNPAYTSQTCSNCGYTDKENRREQASFQCLCCKKKLNADINAARNILLRSSYQSFSSLKHLSLFSNAKTILYYLKEIHKNLIIERFPSLYSWAKILSGNLTSELSKTKKASTGNKLD